MTTQYINGNYGIYQIANQVTTLDIGSAAKLSGVYTYGVYPPSSHPRTTPVDINTAGRITGFYYGIDLTGGGTVANTGTVTGYNGFHFPGAGTAIGIDGAGAIINGSSTNSQATIKGGDAVQLGTGTLINYGVISTYLFVGNGEGHNVAVHIGSGYVRNMLGADISTGISMGSGKVVNNGAIGAGGYQVGGDGYAAGNIDWGVYLGSGTIINGTTNHGAGIAGGVYIKSGAGTVENYGVIGSGLSYFDNYSSYSFTDTRSVQLQAGGKVVNGSATDTGASLSGGVLVNGGRGVITNFGSIVDTGHSANGTTTSTTTTYFPGVSLTDGGGVVNGAATDTGATITGSGGGVAISGGIGSITNFGTIDTVAGVNASAAGVSLADGGKVVNGASNDSAAIIEGVFGVELSGTGTVTNYGTISGTQAAIVFQSKSDRLIEEGSGILTGAVDGGGGTLLLDSKGGAGTLNGLGSTVTGFGTIDVGTNAIWVLSGGSIASGTAFRNNGRVGVAQSDTLTLDTGMGGTGTLAIRQDATAEIKGAVSATETVVFTGTGAMLALDSAANFRGTVSNLAGGGTDELKLLGYGKGTTLSFTPNAGDTGGTLSVTDGNRNAQIALLGQFTASGFHAAISAHYTVITYAPAHAAVIHLGAPSS